ncbi:MAG: serine/threonine-protein kinase [Tepidisphaeraceae bacterium]
MGDRLLHYDLLERLGEGARSTIYRASDTRTGRIVALKHVIRKDDKDIRFIEQMEAEYNISKNFTHPNLRRSLDLKVTKTLLFRVTEAVMIMEYVDAVPLDVQPPPDIFSTLDCFVLVSEGLKAMHNMGYIHCDLKPNNILRSTKGEVKVIDFGQSCTSGTIKERIQGTPDYIAPEQVDRRPVTVQTDVFNLGATLYWALTGRHIPTLYTVNKKGGNSLLSDALFEAPMQLNPLVPPVVSELVMQCVATNPRKRPDDMDTLIHKLEIGKHLIEKARNPNSVRSSDITLHDSTTG